MSLLDNATDAERAVLELVLREMRGARSGNYQLEVMFDPWVTQPGAYVCVTGAGQGFQTEFCGVFKRRQRPGRPRR